MFDVFEIIKNHNLKIKFIWILNNPSLVTNELVLFI